MTELDRRRLLLGGLGGAGALALGSLAAACSDKGETVQEGVSNGPDTALQALFPRDVAYVAAGSPARLPYTLVDAEGIPFADIDGPLSFRVSLDGEAVGEPVELAVHGDGVPRPYLPLPFTFPEPGIYDVETRYGGRDLNSQVQVYPLEEVVQPLVGQPLPPTQTPTVTQTYDVDPICTLSPQCPFHTTELTAALAGDLPVVVLLATPAYCQTTACGPILELLMEEAGDRTDLVVIHAEVYKNPKGVRDLKDAQLAPLPSDYNMTWEPSLFVTDSSHQIVARGDIVVDRTEMAQLLSLAV